MSTTHRRGPATGRLLASREAEASWEAARVAGESDLAVLLTSMRAELSPGQYVFATVRDARTAPGLEVLASVVEPEGLSLVTTREQADEVGLSYDFVAAWITLRVHSALDAVGLTAAVSSALAQAGVSCNVIAGHHHDHLLVPHPRAQEALAILGALGGEGPPGPPASASRQPGAPSPPRPAPA